MLLLAAWLAACSSGSDGEAASPPTGPRDPSPSAATGGIVDGDVPAACDLLTESDATLILDGPVDPVADPVAEGLQVPEAFGAEADTCAYRPVPDDASRILAVAVFPPGAVSADTYRAAAEDSVALGGPGDDGFQSGGTILTRRGDIVVLALAVTIADKAPNLSAGLEIASIVVSRLPSPS